jgi:hypothetical protein
MQADEGEDLFRSLFPPCSLTCPGALAGWKNNDNEELRDV